MVDQAQLLQSLADGAAWGTGFALPFFVGITWAVLKVLSHPNVQKIARAADKFGRGSGGVGETLVKEVFGFLKGGGPPAL